MDFKFAHNYYIENFYGDWLNRELIKIKKNKIFLDNRSSVMLEMIQHPILKAYLEMDISNNPDSIKIQYGRVLSNNQMMSAVVGSLIGYLSTEISECSPFYENNLRDEIKFFDYFYELLIAAVFKKMVLKFGFRKIWVCQTSLFPKTEKNHSLLSVRP